MKIAAERVGPELRPARQASHSLLGARPRMGLAWPNWGDQNWRHSCQGRCHSYTLNSSHTQAEHYAPGRHIQHRGRLESAHVRLDGTQGKSHALREASRLPPSRLNVALAAATPPTESAW